MTDASGTTVSFGERNFGRCDLGDARRTRRLVRAADQILAHPDKALPHKFASPKDYRAVLRLANSPELTHPVVLQAHAQADGVGEFGRSEEHTSELQSRE